MNKTALVTTEKKHAKPILIVDKEGSLGKALAAKLKSEFLIVFVSRAEVLNEENIVYVPFIKKTPSIPDNTFSHILLIGEKETSKEIIKAFAKKAQKDNSQFTVIVDLEHQAKILESLFKSYENTKIVIVGELFSENIIYNKDSTIGKLLLQASNLGKLEIPGDGAIGEFPVLLEDAVESILEAVFVEEKERLFYVFPKNKTTLLSIALMLKKKNPHIRLDFVKEKNKREEDFYIPEGGKYMLPEPYNFDDKIKKISLEKIPKQIYALSDNKTTQTNLIFIPILVFLISLLIIPFLSTLFFLSLGSGFSLGINNWYLSLKSFEIADSSYTILNKQLDFLGAKEKTRFIEESIDSGRKNSESTLLLRDFFKRTKNLFSLGEKNPEEEFSKSIFEIKKAYLIQQEEKQKGSGGLKISKDLSSFLNISSATLELWPEIFGFKGQRNYLVLFQNNLELRPGGGFINFYGILTFDKGKIISFEIYDTAQAVQEKNLHVEPPFPIRRYLPSVTWHLKDSNFNVDFSSGAVASSIFLNSKINKQIDGVVGIDLFFIKNLMSVAGPIKVNNQTIDTDTLFKRVFENKSDDFLEELYKSLGQKISKEKNISYQLLSKAVSDSIFEKHLIFTFNKKTEQAAFSVNGWASTLSDQRSFDGSVNDFLGISETNLRKNKVNHLIERNLSQKVNVEENGKVSENVTLIFKNNALESQQDLIYKNYLRLILPFGASVTGIKIDGENQEIIAAVTDPSVYEGKKFEAPNGLEVEKYSQNQKTIYGFLISINPQQTVKVEIAYALLQKINLQNETLYSLRIFKQPGIDTFPYEFSISLPANAQLIKIPKKFEVSEQSGKTSYKISKDEDINLTLSFR